MLQVEKIETTTRTKHRVVLSDETEWLLYTSDLRRYHITVGAEISQSLREEIQHTCITVRARKRVLALLEKMDRSEADLRTRLKRSGYEMDVVDDAINYAKIYRYIKKPYNPDELVLTVQNALEYWQLKEDNKNLITDLKDLFTGTVTAIVEALDAKDSYTLGRSRRVTSYAIKIAQALHLNDTTIGRIELAALLHDIGMIGVSDDILAKVETLTPEEYSEIKKHVHHSVKILDDIKQLKDVVEVIKYHHEHYDGNGYPYGIKGDEIPIGSRIIAVADAFDSMVTPKVYRKQIMISEALNKIKQNSGTQFDPVVVETFERILPNIIRELREHDAKNRA